MTVRTGHLASIVLLVACSATAASATFVESFERLAQGRFAGTVLDSEGGIVLAPRIVELSLDGVPDRPTQVFSVAEDGGGTIYLGTGPDGRVLRVDAEGRTRAFASVDAPIVSALAVAGDGSLLAGTAPGGRIVRIDRAGRVEPWCDSGEAYVWAIAVAADGRIFAGTGERGRLLEIDPSGTARVVLDSDDTHIVSLAVSGDTLLAGGAGRGLVYRVDRAGRGGVVLDDGMPEVRGVVVERDGSIVVALHGARSRPGPPPSVTLRVGPTPGDERAPDEPVRPERAIRGEIVGLAPGPVEPSGPRGRVLRIAADGARRRVLWESAAEAPFALALDRSGRAVFGTGEPARLWRVEGDLVARLATLVEAQLTAIAVGGGTGLVATSNPAALYRVLPETVDTGSFESAPIDVGARAAWGRIGWRATGPAGSVELSTRSGNGRVPDATWSDWSPRLTLAGGSRIVSPAARFLQWRARLIGPGRATRLSDVAVQFAATNRPPTLAVADRRAGGAWTADALGVRVEAADPDGDRLELRLEYRAGDRPWLVGARATHSPDDVGSVELRWSTAELAEGRYGVRVLAADQPSNPPGEGLEAVVELGPLTVDRTPPTLEVDSGAGASLRVSVTDAVSPVSRLELYELLETSDGERLAATARADDGVCDDRTETFTLPAPGPGSWLLRGIDAAGNRADRRLAPR